MPATSRASDLLPTDEQLELRAGAWDQSVALERSGQLEQARVLLLRGWGLESRSYEVTVRVAWLSLQLEDSGTAVVAYQRARGLAGAGAEATQGLASALTLRGWQHFDDGDRAAARGDWRQAIELQPDQPDAQRGLDLARELRFEPELWGAAVFTTGSGNDSIGGAGFIHLPIQIKDWLSFRAAYRHVATSESVAAPTAPPGRPPGGGTVRLHQNEIYAGGSVGTEILLFEALGVALWPSDERFAGGEAARLRLGYDYGLQLEQAVLAREGGVNGQLMPSAFVWPLDRLGLGAGARFTFDPDGIDVSAVAGVSIVPEPVAIHLRFHAGLERWPVTMAMPQVLTLADEVNVGGSLTALFDVSETWSVGISGQVERLNRPGQAGVFGSAGAGLRWSPKL
ncbi:MAG: hypothetical protein JRI23_17280 [Deltaproteobacteria bacterium]|nr:hypothetical protein [Deltaproteobacteria bacterium]MBW2533572.1 hypothetical protein [Deltaproteobacteria bacterium]